METLLGRQAVFSIKHAKSQGEIQRGQNRRHRAVGQTDKESQVTASPSEDKLYETGSDIPKNAMHSTAPSPIFLLGPCGLLAKDRPLGRLVLVFRQVRSTVYSRRATSKGHSPFLIRLSLVTLISEGQTH